MPCVCSTSLQLTDIIAMPQEAATEQKVESDSSSWDTMSDEVVKNHAAQLLENAQSVTWGKVTRKDSKPGKHPG